MSCSKIHRLLAIAAVLVVGDPTAGRAESIQASQASYYNTHDSSYTSENGASTLTTETSQIGYNGGPIYNTQEIILEFSLPGIAAGFEIGPATLALNVDSNTADPGAISFTAFSENSNAIGLSGTELGTISPTTITNSIDLSSILYSSPHYIDLVINDSEVGTGLTIDGLIGGGTVPTLNFFIVAIPLPTPVPEPTSATMLGLAMMAGLGIAARQRRAKRLGSA